MLIILVLLSESFYIPPVCQWPAKSTCAEKESNSEAWFFAATIDVNIDVSHNRENPIGLSSRSGHRSLAPLWTHVVLSLIEPSPNKSTVRKRTVRDNPPLGRISLRTKNILTSYGTAYVQSLRASSSSDCCGCVCVRLFSVQPVLLNVTAETKDRDCVHIRDRRLDTTKIVGRKERERDLEVN